jgi:AcrR family transcriptional regulator
MKALSDHNDQETRQRLIMAATRLMAERGFRRVSVREICKEAGANVAAVNYYFRSKLGLYAEVWKSLIEATMEQTQAMVVEEGKGKSPEEKLRAYIRVQLQALVNVGDQKGFWLGRLVAHETSEPTLEPIEGSDRTIWQMALERGILPKFLYLCEVVSEMIGCPANDAKTIYCAASIQGQCLMFAQAKEMLKLVNPNVAGFGYSFFSAENTEKLIAHVTEFSLAGIRAMAAQQVEIHS